MIASSLQTFAVDAHDLADLTGDVRELAVKIQRIVPGYADAALLVVGDGPLVVREKVHPASPMTLDQAMYEMELVGHDFFLFVDKDSERPSVVYRRRGYDYGVIALDLT